uniref:NADH-ubiquinone oxidoreductase chain 1 n=1 Tax=Cryptonome barbada TaxID=2204078 RepID=A0A343YV53_9ANNE|nr:NADH dehydrogenase subunit 1 [Cryptonome barbada]AWN55974.1 NADH dehydrogenase subunit 1 [Cryptonome barbada]
MSHITPIIAILLNYLLALLAMAFYTLLERKALGYFQNRKGPNKVSISGLPQPLADALKLFAKEQSRPTLSNQLPFFISPMFSLVLALTLWSLYPYFSTSYFTLYTVLLFICISSLNVYSTLASGWSSNSKYALLGALRGVAQTISYEVSMSLILLGVLAVLISMNFTEMVSHRMTPPLLLLLPLFATWFTTSLAETNRTPFDFAEGESELVSGFNTEYSAGPFALIFMAEYASIIVMSLFTTIFFLPSYTLGPLLSPLSMTLSTLGLAFLFIWVRATFPRMRYDRLMALTWKVFLPMILFTLCPIICLSTNM